MQGSQTHIQFPPSTLTNHFSSEAILMARSLEEGGHGILCYRKEIHKRNSSLLWCFKKSQRAAGQAVALCIALPAVNQQSMHHLGYQELSPLTYLGD